MTYQEFIQSKQHISINSGIEPNFFPEMLFPFQKHVSEYAIKKGRAAGFIGTGLGKTLMEMTIASNYVRHTNKPSLILTPLAVAPQFINEAEKFGIDDVSQTKDGKISSKIVLCNYERLHYLDPSFFDCVILDESSILKNDEGKIRKEVTAFLRKVPYRFLFTATPSPNDYMELGTSSEALGYLGFMDMVSKFFKNNQGNVSRLMQSQTQKGANFYLKPHAENDFWRWVSSWSISLQKPSDIGFSDDGYILPKLNEIDHVLQNETPLSIDGQYSLFALPATGFREVKAETKVTINQRCEVAAKLSEKHDVSVYWVNLNPEASTLAQIDKNAVEINGTMHIDKKEEILTAFGSGQIKKLITKPTITAFGLNWQHCNHATVFPTDSYEQYFQLVRRFWRFGQKNEVNIERIYSDGQILTMKRQEQKHAKAVQMYANLIKQSNQTFNMQTKGFDKPVNLPQFLSI